MVVMERSEGLDGLTSVPPSILSCPRPCGGGGGGGAEVKRSSATSSLPTIILIDLVIVIMPPKKRRRAASAVEDGNAVSSINAATTKPVSLAGFALLPAELKQHVIDLACIASSSSSSPPSKRCLFNTDTATALALSLTSRDLNALATPSLYRAIVIIRPSALYFLHRTLKAHPRRAKLTRRLHIGPLDALPANWWPLDNAYSEGEGWTAGNNFALGRPYTWIKTTLDQAQLPVGYSPNHSWALLRLEPGCREAAITYALEAAQNYLNVDASSEGQNTSTTKVAGILEVQAALDLYLEDIRDSEGEDEKLKRLGQPGARVPAQCRNGNCKHYKTLCITGATARRRISGSGGPLGGTSYVPRTALLRHLARPRTVSDRFDHPLLFARSGFEATVTSNLGSGHRYAYLAGGASYTLGSETWDLQGVHEKHVWPDLALVQRDMMQWEQEYRRRQEDEEDEECQGWAEYAVTCSSILANMGTLGQTMCFVRSMLASLTNLQDLSLTGYLEAIFDDKQQQVGHLRRLSFGPSAPSWNEQLGLVGFTGLEKLHISGIALNEREIRCITNEMPRLQEFRWSMIEQVYISGNLR